MSPPSSSSNNNPGNKPATAEPLATFHDGLLLVLIFDPEVGSEMFLGNVG
jgi:hypothetical protein